TARGRRSRTASTGVPPRRISLNPIASLDGPVDGQVVHHVVPVEGWVLLGGRPASLIEVFVEDRAPVRARRCEPRPDLVGAIGVAPPDDLAAGFRELVALGDLARTAGEVTVIVRAHGHDGGQWQSAPVTVVVEVEDDTTPVEIPDPLVAPDADT